MSGWLLIHSCWCVLITEKYFEGYRYPNFMTRHWFTSENASSLRQYLRHLFLMLFQEQATEAMKQLPCMRDGLVASEVALVQEKGSMYETIPSTKNRHPELPNHCAPASRTVELLWTNYCCAM